LGAVFFALALCLDLCISVALWFLPGRLADPRDITFFGMFPKADAAQTKIAHDTARPPTELASPDNPSGELRLFLAFSNLCFRCHNNINKDQLYQIYHS
jgi:hypothetical protein